MSTPPEAPLEPSLGSPRPSGWAVALVLMSAVLVLAAVGAAFLEPGAGPSLAPSWQNLPNPTLQNIAGQPLAEQGGTGSDTITLVGLKDQAVTVSVICEGEGQIFFAVGNISLGDGRCFAGQSVQYQLHTSARSWLASKSYVSVITTSATLLWRVRINATAS